MVANRRPARSASDGRDGRRSRSGRITASGPKQTRTIEDMPMSQDRWSAVDDYITDHLISPDSVLEAALTNSAAAGLPAINVTPNQGKFLHLLARAHRARSILEVGTLGGYSTIWLARTLPTGGRLVTLEADPK